MKKASQVRPWRGRGFPKQGGGGGRGATWIRKVGNVARRKSLFSQRLVVRLDQGRLPSSTRPLVTASSLLEHRCLYSSCYARHLKEDTRTVETAVQARAPQHSRKKPEVVLCASNSTSSEAEARGSLEHTEHARPASLGSSRFSERCRLTLDRERDIPSSRLASAYTRTHMHIPNSLPHPPLPM